MKPQLFLPLSLAVAALSISGCKLDVKDLGSPRTQSDPPAQKSAVVLAKALLATNAKVVFHGANHAVDSAPAGHCFDLSDSASVGGLIDASAKDLPQAGSETTLNPESGAFAEAVERENSVPAQNGLLTIPESGVGTFSVEGTPFKISVSNLKVGSGVPQVKAAYCVPPGT